MSKQDSITTIKELLQPGYVVAGEPDDYGIEFTAKDGTHKARLTAAGITFTSNENALHYYAFGLSHLSEIRHFLRTKPGFDADTVAKAQQEEAKTKSPYQKRKEGKPKTTKEKGPSVRGTIFQLLGEGKTQDEMVAALKIAFPEQEEKTLKARIYLHRSEWKKKQGGAV